MDLFVDFGEVGEEVVCETGSADDGDVYGGGGVIHGEIWYALTNNCFGIDREEPCLCGLMLMRG